MKYWIGRLVIIGCFLLCASIYAQSVMFYNVENYFDCQNDSLTNDDDFTPNGVRGWTAKRQREKRDKIAKVILSAGGWSVPQIVGLCEIENHEVLYDLIEHSPLKKIRYKAIHRESPDHRGIDVALLYKEDEFSPLHVEWMPLVSENGNILSTREMIYCKGVSSSSDTIHAFVVHWPSRFGGQMRSEPTRILAAQTVRYKVDSIFFKNIKAKILLMGDFNDYPSNRSVKEFLCKSDLVNLAVYLDKKGIGSHKYKGRWGMLDQMIVSKSLAKKCKKNSLSILDEKFLIREDRRYLGIKPLRTYEGMRYKGGFSDHLPILLKWNL